jgi:hypothetical protein
VPPSSRPMIMMSMSALMDRLRLPGERIAEVAAVVSGPFWTGDDRDTSFS